MVQCRTYAVLSILVASDLGRAGNEIAAVRQWIIDAAARHSLNDWRTVECAWRHCHWTTNPWVEINSSIDLNACSEQA